MACGEGANILLALVLNTAAPDGRITGVELCRPRPQSNLTPMCRHRCDPLADNRRPHWLTVSDLHRNLIACEVLPAGADLRGVLRITLARWAADGWQVENDGAYGFAFIAKGAERR